MTEWSDDDIKKYGASTMMFPDDVVSIGWSNQVSGSGDGYVNNATNLIAPLTTTMAGSPEVFENSGYIKRLLVNPPVVAGAGGALNGQGWPTTAGGFQQMAAQVGKGATVLGSAGANSNIITLYYLHRIRLIDIHPLFKELDLCANPQLKLTLYVNTGTATMSVNASNNLSLTSVVMTQGNTCPVMVSSAATGNALAPVLNATATTLQLAWGVMGNSITTSGVGQYYPYSTTRLYIPFYDLVPEKAMELVKQPVKKSQFLDYYSQSFKGQAGTANSLSSQLNTNFSLQLSSSLKNVKYVALIPFANTATSGTNGHYATATNIDQYASPFDSAPWTCQAGAAITNFNVQVGNKWVYNAAQNYDFQGFLDEFCKIGALNGGLTHEVSNGLIDEDKWSYAQRIMVADVSRLTDKDVPTSLLISGTNSSSAGSDFIVLVAYERSVSLNRITGEIEQFS